MNGEKITPVKSGDGYNITMTNIGAKHLKDNFTIVFGGSYTVKFCALSYPYAILSSEDTKIKSDENLIALIKALCDYRNDLTLTKSKTDSA